VRKAAEKSICKLLYSPELIQLEGEQAEEGPCEEEEGPCGECTVSKKEGGRGSNQPN
jgi:hypothetical protein